MPFGDLFKLPQGFKRPRSAPNRMEGLNFGQKLNYMGQFEGPSLMALGAGISSGHPEQGFRDMAKIQQGYQQDYAGEMEQDRIRQQTTQYLISQGMDPSQAEAAAQNPAIMQHIFQLEEEKARQTSGDKVFGTPIYGTDTKTGRTGIGTFDKQGNFQVINTGDFEVSSGVKTYDTPTEVVTVNTRTGDVISREPKDIAGAKRQEKIGMGQGDAAVLLKSMETKMPGLQQTIATLNDLAKKATYTAGGQLYDVIRKQTGQEPREAAVARTEYIKMVDTEMIPLLRDMLGAQFTASENTMVRGILGDPDMHPTEKQAVLRNFIAGKLREIQAIAGQAAPTTNGGGNGGITIEEVPD